jgi:hypothetical protein
MSARLAAERCQAHAATVNPSASTTPSIAITHPHAISDDGRECLYMQDT